MQIMSRYSTLLSQPQLSVISERADAELSRIQRTITNHVQVEGRNDLEELLCQLVALAAATPTTSGPKTLDLIGHSAPGTSLLQLGDFTIDADNTCVTAFFRELADHDILPRLGVRAMRLLGCHTAATPAGRHTIAKLAELLDVEVYGSRDLIFAAHYDTEGFHPDWSFLLAGSQELAHVPVALDSSASAARYDRPLDIDALPVSALRPTTYPRRLVSHEAAREILRLVRRTEGARTPGLLATPSCELALPSGHDDTYHLVQILLDGMFVRTYPQGPDQAGVLYPVSEPNELTRLVDALPELVVG